jgi:hypothetical protein
LIARWSRESSPRAGFLIPEALYYVIDHPANQAREQAFQLARDLMFLVRQQVGDTRDLRENTRLVNQAREQVFQ